MPVSCHWTHYPNARWSLPLTNPTQLHLPERWISWELWFISVTIKKHATFVLPNSPMYIFWSYYKWSHNSLYFAQSFISLFWTLLRLVGFFMTPKACWNPLVIIISFVVFIIIANFLVFFSANNIIILAKNDWIIVFIMFLIISGLVFLTL